MSTFYYVESSHIYKPILSILQNFTYKPILQSSQINGINFFSLLSIPSTESLKSKLVIGVTTPLHMPSKHDCFC